jgi:hypothetical protein
LLGSERVELLLGNAPGNVLWNEKWSWLVAAGAVWQVGLPPFGNAGWKVLVVAAWEVRLPPLGNAGWKVLVAAGAV